MDVRKLNGVIVIDPFPEAHYGHTTIVISILANLPADSCNKRNGIPYIAGIKFEFLFF